MPYVCEFFAGFKNSFLGIMRSPIVPRTDGKALSVESTIISNRVFPSQQSRHADHR